MKQLKLIRHVAIRSESLYLVGEPDGQNHHSWPVLFVSMLSPTYHARQTPFLKADHSIKRLMSPALMRRPVTCWQSQATTQVIQVSL
jgi:hypothetical protein